MIFKNIVACGCLAMQYGIKQKSVFLLVYDLCTLRTSHSRMSLDLKYAMILKNGRIIDNLLKFFKDSQFKEIGHRILDQLFHRFRAYAPEDYFYRAVRSFTGSVRKCIHRLKNCPIYLI